MSTVPELDPAGVAALGGRLAANVRRAVKVARIQSVINRTLDEDEDEIEVPANLAVRVRAKIKGTSLAWDAAVSDLANRDVNEEYSSGD